MTTPKTTFTMTFKVVKGEWDQGGFGDIPVFLSRFVNEDLLLKLDADDIPKVGNKPADGFKEGSWDPLPNTEMVIEENKTYTYTYSKKRKISATITFKVVHGSWNDGTVKNKTVTLTGFEGDIMKLKSDQIPAVGEKPDELYKAGTWDVTPSSETAITGNTT